MKKVLSLSLVLILSVSLFAIPALAGITNANTTAWDGNPGYEVSAKTDLGDKFTEVYGFRFTVKSDALAFGGEGKVNGETDYFAFMSTQQAAQAFGAPNKVLAQIEQGETGYVEFVDTKPLFSAGSKGTMVFNEWIAQFGEGGDITISKFVWLDASGNVLTAGGGSSGDNTDAAPSNPKTGDNAFIFIALVFVSACVIIISKRVKKNTI
ncbi:MAG: hypothetical protein FWG36_08695 [Oscillospiraceae bacterium]|nr:hypothetical protein [Oscillospiraceae bacterium]